MFNQLAPFRLSDFDYHPQAVCGIIKSTAEAIFVEYIGKCNITSIYFEHLTLGSHPPKIHGKQELSQYYYQSKDKMYNFFLLS